MPMTVKLVHSGAVRYTEDIVVDRFPFLLGRHPDCDHQVYHPLVSRRHCQLSQAGGTLVLRDLHSKNGTYVNGNRVHETHLREGDEINLACFPYRVSFSLSACPAFRPCPTCFTENSNSLPQRLMRRPGPFSKASTSSRVIQAKSPGSECLMALAATPQSRPFCRSPSSSPWISPAANESPAPSRSTISTSYVRVRSTRPSCQAIAVQLFFQTSGFSRSVTATTRTGKRRATCAATSS